eukprot:s282_g27.t1
MALDFSLLRADLLEKSASKGKVVLDERQFVHLAVILTFAAALPENAPELAVNGFYPLSHHASLVSKQGCAGR